MGNSLISVVVPVYNVEQYIDRCITSIEKQTYSHLQIILVDDGSTDSSGKKCDLLAKGDKRIQVIHKTNGGLSSARNEGIKVAQGEYITFIDSDDFFQPDSIEYLYGLIKNYQADIAVGNYIRTTGDIINGINRESSNEKVLTGKQAIEMQFEANTVQMVSAWGKLYDTRLFNDIAYLEGVLHEDEATTYKLYYKCNRVVVSNKIVYGYFVNLQSITSRPKKKNYTDLCSILMAQINFFHVHGETTLEERVRNRYSIQMMSHLFPLNYYGNSKAMISDARKTYRSKILKNQEIPLLERMKGWSCTYFGIEVACALKLIRLLKGIR